MNIENCIIVYFNLAQKFYYFFPIYNINFKMLPGLHIVTQ